MENWPLIGFRGRTSALKVLAAGLLCFAQGHGVLEMPSGTGKTISLLSLIVAYQKVSFDALLKCQFLCRGYVAAVTSTF